MAWIDNRGDGDIYAQRIDVTGAPRGTQDGAPVCTAPNHQWLGGMVADGVGGAFLVWDDGRDQGTNGTDIYAARVNTVTSLSLSELSATADAEGVRLTWRISESVRDLTAILVQSAGGPAGAWNTIARLTPEATSYLDPWSTGGETPWYRLLLLSSGSVAASPVVQALPPPAQMTLDPPRLGADGVLIRFTLAYAAHVRLRVHDVRGRLVRTLDQRNRDHGSHIIVWDLGGSGGSVATGVYVLRLESGGAVAMRKLPLFH